MKRNNVLVVFFSSVIIMVPDLSSAQHTHGHGSSGGNMKMDTREVLVENFKVTFQIMANNEHRKMLKDMNMKDDIEAGTTHNVTVTLSDPVAQTLITDAAISMKVVDPTGEDQIKRLKYEDSMKSYDGYFNMPDKGRYELLVLIRQGDRRTSAGAYYELK